MTTRGLIATTLRFALLLWFCVALHRSSGQRMHMRPDPRIPDAYIHDNSYCDRRPFLPKLGRRLLGLPWPGSYVCPDHPRDRYFEHPDPSWGPDLPVMLIAIAVVVALFAYLLILGGIRPVAVTVAISAHAVFLLCCLPNSGDLAAAWPAAQGACTYAVLAIDRPWLRAAVVILGHAAVALAARADPPILCLFIAFPLSLWTGLVIVLRDWARGIPGGDPASMSRRIA